MDSKNIYIVLAVVLVAFVGYMTYRHFSKEKDLKAHSEDKYKRLLAMSKKSPRIGLSEMAAALKKYHAAKKAYPDSLDALYPDIIGSKAFIDEIAWDYQPGEGNFYLAKSIERGGKTLVAHTDSSLKTRMGSGTRVARAGRRKAAGRAGSTASAGGDIGGFKVASGMALLKSLEIPDLTPEEVDETKHIDVVRIEPRIVLVDETETPSDFASAVSDTYLVWRDPDGHIGIGNVQYPDSRQIAIATRDKWYNVTRKPTFETVTKTDEIAPKALADTGENFVATGIDSGYMAWKDENGNIGFGNVQYPESGEPVSIYVDGKWQKFEKSKSL